MKKTERPTGDDRKNIAPKKSEVPNAVSDPQFDDLTLLAASVCQTPIALISLFDEQGFVTKSTLGLAANQSLDSSALCRYAVNRSTTLLVEDLNLDDRFNDISWPAGQPALRFYAGAQLRRSDGSSFGMLCVMDHQPRKLKAEQVSALEALARTAVVLLEKFYQSKELELKSKFLTNLTSALPNLVAYLDRDFRYQYANTAYDSWFELGSASVLGRTVEEVVGEETFEIVREYLERALSGHAVEFQMKAPYLVHGRIRPRTVRVNYIPDIEADGSINGIFAVVTDLTDKTIAMEKLSAKEREVQRIFDAIPAMVGHWDENQCNLSANHAYSTYFNKSPDQIKGKHIKDLLGPDLYQKNLPFIEGALSGRPQTFERAIPIKGGGIKHTLANYLPDIEGTSVRGFFVIVTDVSELKAVEGERKALEAKMISSAKLAELGEMAGGIAHEINSPLGAIIGRVGIMRERIALDQFDADVFVKDLSKIEATTARISKIITGLKAISRGSDLDSLADVPVGTLLQNTLELCQERFKEEGVELRVESHDGLSVYCREAQVSQILLNLLGNSLDAIRDLPEKWVSLEFEKTGDVIRFYVTDSGRGIDDETAEKIMQPFFTTKEIGKGTGLGLSVSLGLARAQKGNLFLVKPSVHTKFCLELSTRTVENFSP
jgi:PAS domain S-box-containing protein